MRATSTPWAARKPVRSSHSLIAASSAILPSRANARSSAAASSGSPLMARKRSISARVSLGSVACGFGAPEGFDAGLQEFARLLRAMAKNGSKIAVTFGGAGCGRGEIVPGNRDRQVGTQAQLAALRVDGEKHALADVLAGEIEKRLRRLQDRGRYARIARALEIGHERLRPCVGFGRSCCGRGADHGALVWTI